MQPTSQDATEKYKKYKEALLFGLLEPAFM